MAVLGAVVGCVVVTSRGRFIQSGVAMAGARNPQKGVLEGLSVTVQLSELNVKICFMEKTAEKHGKADFNF